MHDTTIYKDVFSGNPQEKHLCSATNAVNLNQLMRVGNDKWHFDYFQRHIQPNATFQTQVHNQNQLLFRSNTAENC